MTTTKPRLSAMLGQVATIAKVSSSSLGLRRLDKQASKESDRAHNALSGTGKTTVSRLAGAEHRVQEINDIANAVTAGLESMTTKWGGFGRLLPNTALQDWLRFYTPLKKEYDRKVEALIADAPALIAQAEANKGTYNVKLPTLQEFEKAFSLAYEMIQIPDSDSFRATGVQASMEAEMKRHFEAGIEASYAQAQQDAIKRVAEPVSHLVERIKVFDRTEDEKARGVVSSSARMYESVITNVQDIAKTFRSFNLTNDPLLTSVADKLEAFEGVDIEDIKGSESLRKDLSKRADAILADLKDLI